MQNEEDARFSQEFFESDEQVEIESISNKFQCKWTKFSQVEKELGLIRLSWPSVDLEDENLVCLPVSYRTTSDKEKLLFWCAENFRKQYHTVYRDRRPLLLVCDNECGIQVKF